MADTSGPARLDVLMFTIPPDYLVSIIKTRMEQLFCPEAGILPVSIAYHFRVHCDTPGEFETEMDIFRRAGWYPVQWVKEPRLDNSLDVRKNRRREAVLFTVHGRRAQP